MKELETKILDIDLDEVRNKIKYLNLENVKCENQINNLFDFPNKTLLAKKGYARVRFVEDLLNNKVVYYMTTKKMISQDKFKVMEEIEIEVSDGEEAIKLFESLGLELVGSVKKYRESYRYKNSLIEIDINDESFCPFPYIEIETSTEEELKEVVDLLGYTMEDTSSKTIYDILNDKGITPKSPLGI
ncbi:class IV adenylate cyclase [Clostridium algidicarnis]|uniref:class IV adenylate cyclase n=1 Tax=Clostridium algidicarnis TaxID=37659 RepID=UPI001C0B8BFF|nr:CYTH domain-containing protein [Clostridium algidicarnis]MBU3227153.1 CYTH domain-containing protein [Clostridium algidicarnis]MBU3250678.1 CYTH domain-containing protein [Clostridium algidicarnis]